MIYLAQITPLAYWIFMKKRFKGRHKKLNMNQLRLTIRCLINQLLVYLQSGLKAQIFSKFFFYFYVFGEYTDGKY